MTQFDRAVEKLLELGYHYNGSAWVVKVLDRYKVTTPPGPSQTHSVVRADNEAQARGEAAVRSSAFEDPACTCVLLDPKVRWCKFCEVKPAIQGAYGACGDPECVAF